jgi:UDPglucose 6-dehydrogenase
MTYRVGVVGIGYVGLTTAVCLAARGIDTVCVDVDATKVDALNRGRTELDEPGLHDLLERGLRSGGLRFSADMDELRDRDVVFVCVPTPSGEDGAADISSVESVVTALAGVLAENSVIALKSTVPVGTSRAMGRRVAKAGVKVVSTPEFLREGSAVTDFQNPERVLVGAADDHAAHTVEQLLGAGSQKTLHMCPESAELAKYASNAFLAVKLSYTNSLANLCAHVGADIGAVTTAMGADSRIGSQFLRPGPGWGGSCLPKDTAALVHIAGAHGVPMPEVSAARTTNVSQLQRICEAIEQHVGRKLHSVRVAALGLTFKAGTSDVRDSPALTVCDHLMSSGAQLMAFDPRLNSIDERVLHAYPLVTVNDPYLASKDADVIVVLTEWPEFRELDWPVIARHAPGAVVLDTRNVLERAVIEDSGLRYVGNGTTPGF